MAKTEFELKKILGRGSFGSVSLYKSKEPLEGKTLYYAVKTSDDESLFKEFNILSEFRGCSRIIQCYGNRVGERLDDEGFVEYKMLLEYASGGSLTDFMGRFKDGKLPESLIKEFTRMLLQGLATIHKHGYVHCDLKPENILVFPSRVYKNGTWRRTYELKISDFGLTKRDGDTSWWQLLGRFAGTPIYMSPESISHGEIGRGHDLWALGCIVLEMFTGKSPWWHKEDYLEDLMMCYEPLIPDDLTPDAKFFLSTCFAAEPEERKDAMTLLGYTFLSETRESPLYVKSQNRILITQRLEKIRHNLWKLGACV